MLSRIAVFIAIFFLGYTTFVVLGVSFGPHPQSFKILGATASLSAAFDRCDSSMEGGALVRCIRSHMDNAMKYWGLHTLMEAVGILEKKAALGSVLQARCHDISHALGQMDGMTRGDINASIMACTDACSFGCYHGVIEGWLGSGHDTPSDISSLCQGHQLSEERRVACFHGVGHVIATVHTYDIQTSLHYCDMLADGDRIGCGSGVFMEVYDVNPFTNHVPLPLPKNNPYWCESLSAPYNEICYNRAGAYAYLEDKNLNRALTICRQEPTQFQGGCAGEIVKKMFFSLPLEADQLQQAQAICRLAGEDLYARCYEEFLGK